MIDVASILEVDRQAAVIRLLVSVLVEFGCSK
jgi:hypothetical protein